MTNDRPGQPSFYITKENFEQLVGNGFWRINDIPLAHLSQVKDHLAGVDTLAVFASGIAPRALAGNEPRVGGIDWVRLERNPKSDEPPLNVYHYPIGPFDGHGYPVYGPILNGSIAPHWADLKDLVVYLDFDDPKTTDA